MLVAWLVFGVVLLLFELHHLAFYALFVAVGAFAAALVALFAPGAIAVQTGVAIAVSIAGVVGMRPYVSKAYASHHTGEVARGVHGGLVGQPALTLDAVADEHKVGHVRLAGERWLAVSGGGITIAAGTPVVVTAVQGTTLVVWPVESPPPQLPAQSDVHEDAPDGAEGKQQ